MKILIALFLTFSVAQASDFIVIKSVTKQTFTSSGTYTPNAKMKYAVIEAVGGGGGAGGAATVAAGEAVISGSGGGGGYARRLVTAAQVGASQVVTIGAGGTGSTSNINGIDGGDTSVGSLVVAHGGGRGSGELPVTVFPAVPRFNGSGGTATGGDVNITGASGAPGLLTSNIFCADSIGGASFFSQPNYDFINCSDVAQNGPNGSNPGQGGGGACTCKAAGGLTKQGGSGANGIVIITEYNSQ